MDESILEEIKSKQRIGFAANVKFPLHNVVGYMIEDEDGEDEDYPAGWYLYLVDISGSGTCHHFPEPFATKKEALAAARATGLPWEPTLYHDKPDDLPAHDSAE